MSETLSQMKESQLFKGFSDDNLEKIIALGKEQEYKTGESLMSEDAPSENFFLILDGRVNIEVSVPWGSKSQEIVCRKPGEVIGELVLAGRQRRSATVTARNDCKVLTWGHKEFLEFCESNPDIGYRFMQNLASLLSEKLVDATLAIRRMIEPGTQYLY